MKLLKGWAILSAGDTWREPWRGEPYWAFDVFKEPAEARRCKSIGERVVPVEYRFPRRKRK